MPRKAKQIQLWTVRNSKGQFLATYYAYTAQEAIAKLIRDQGQYTSTFRKSGTRCNFSDSIATVEPR